MFPDLMENLENSYIAPDKVFYETTASEEERLLLRSRVFFLEPNIVYAHEVPNMTEYSIKVMGNKLNELIESVDKFVLLVDITDTKRPNAEIRNLLKITYKNPKILTLILFTGKNFLVNTSAKFVAAAIMGSWNFHVVKEREEAIEIARSKFR